MEEIFKVDEKEVEHGGKGRERILVETERIAGDEGRRK
jgi:hypothetical protein